MALGAPRATIIRQMLTESLVLWAASGGLVGLAVAYLRHAVFCWHWRFHSRNRTSHPSYPRRPVVLGFAFALSLLTGLIFGVAPAWMTSHSEPAEALRGSNRSTKDSSSMLQRSLVVLQAALSLDSASRGRLADQEPEPARASGLRRRSGIIVSSSTSRRSTRAINPRSCRPCMTQSNSASMRPRRRACGPCALHAARGRQLERRCLHSKAAPRPGLHENNGASWTRVSPEFLELIGQKLVRGRGITAQDTATAPEVALVNEAFVKRFFPNGENPIGVHFAEPIDVPRAQAILRSSAW